jgi:hypothetical protein
MQWRGFVSNTHPSEVMPLQWPEVPGGSITGSQSVQLGVSLEPLSAYFLRHRKCCFSNTINAGVENKLELQSF